MVSYPDPAAITHPAGKGLRISYRCEYSRDRRSYGDSVSSVARARGRKLSVTSPETEREKNYT